MSSFNQPAVAWGHEGVRSDQDRSDGRRFENGSGRIVLCDGIGSHKGSGDYADAVIAAHDNSPDVQLSNLLGRAAELVEAKQVPEEGGTTVLTASVTADTNGNSIWCSLEYVGNGGAVRVAGNFSEQLRFNAPYRYHQLILPDVDPQTALIRFFGKDKERYAESGKVKVLLQHPYGDIVLLYSDGIDSLEDAYVVGDGENRFWSLQSNVLLYVLTELDRWLLTRSDLLVGSTFEDDLNGWLKQLLVRLRTEDRVEDDVALGIIITPRVLKYYETRKPTADA